MNDKFDIDSCDFAYLRLIATEVSKQKTKGQRGTSCSSNIYIQVAEECTESIFLFFQMRDKQWLVI